jgi:hypothetical protein
MEMVIYGIKRHGDMLSAPNSRVSAVCDIKQYLRHATNVWILVFSKSRHVALVLPIFLHPPNRPSHCLHAVLRTGHYHVDLSLYLWCYMKHNLSSRTELPQQLHPLVAVFVFKHKQLRPSYPTPSVLRVPRVSSTHDGAVPFFLSHRCDARIAESLGQVAGMHTT